MSRRAFGRGETRRACRARVLCSTSTTVSVCLTLSPRDHETVYPSSTCTFAVMSSHYACFKTMSSDNMHSQDSTGPVSLTR